MNFDQFLELFLSGITKGSIYALIALGYTMVYGIIELINFAHGEIYMIGAFVALVVASLLGVMGFPMLGILAVATLCAVLWSAAYGYTVEKLAYRPLRSASCGSCTIPVLYFLLSSLPMNRIWLSLISTLSIFLSSIIVMKVP